MFIHVCSEYSQDLKQAWILQFYLTSVNFLFAHPGGVHSLLCIKNRPVDLHRGCNESLKNSLKDEQSWSLTIADRMEKIDFHIEKISPLPCLDIFHEDFRWSWSVIKPSSISIICKLSVELKITRKRSRHKFIKKMIFMARNWDSTRSHFSQHTYKWLRLIIRAYAKCDGHEWVLALAECEIGMKKRSMSMTEILYTLLYSYCLLFNMIFLMNNFHFHSSMKSTKCVDFVDDIR